MNTQQASRLSYKFHTHQPTIHNGISWTYPEFQREFGRIYPQLLAFDNNSKFDIPRIVRIYTSINKVLARRGMAIKASNYYETFKLIERPQDKVDSCTRQAHTLTRYAGKLQTGITNYNSRFTKRLTKRETAAIAREHELDVILSKRYN